MTSATPLLAIRNLDVTYTRTGGARHHAVRSVDLDIAAGEVVALVGESGSGKSTIAQAVLRLSADNAAVHAERLIFDGQDVTRLSEPAVQRLRGRDIGWVPQDPGLSLDPVRRIGDQIAQVFTVHKLASRAQAQAKAIEILAAVGLPDPESSAKRYPHELSGGQRQRVLIGIAIAARPKLIVADEPTTALDVTTQRVVMDLLIALAKDHGTAVLLITHDLALAAERANRVIVLKDGQIVENGPAAATFQSPREPYTQALVAAAPTLDSPRLRPLQTGGEVVLSAHRISKSFARKRLWQKTPVRLAVDDVSLTLPRGTTLGIVGESGSGKSTTARMLLRLYDPDSGEIRLDDTDITALHGEEMRQIRKRIQFVHQDPYASLDPGRTVGQIIATSLDAFDIGDRRSRAARVRDLIAKVALPPDSYDRLPRELSGGQRQRVAIARALASAPEIVVLDEAVSALDVSVQAQILALLTDLQIQMGLSYVFISHNLAVVQMFCDNLIIMQQGRIVDAGRADRLRSATASAYTRALFAAVPNVPAPAAGL